MYNIYTYIYIYIHIYIHVHICYGHSLNPHKPAPSDTSRFRLDPWLAVAWTRGTGQASEAVELPRVPCGRGDFHGGYHGKMVISPRRMADFDGFWMSTWVYPLVNIQKNYGTSPFSSGKSTVNGQFQYFFVCLPEGRWYDVIHMGHKWGYPKWMVYNGTSHLQMDDLGVPPFKETSHICIHILYPVGPTTCKGMVLQVQSIWHDLQWRTNIPLGTAWSNREDQNAVCRVGTWI